MNYEELYVSLQEKEKTLKEKLSAMQRLNKNLMKETENGDLKGFTKDISTMMEINLLQASVLQELKETVEAFDAKAYFENGDFAKQMPGILQGITGRCQRRIPGL